MIVEWNDERTISDFRLLGKGSRVANPKWQSGEYLGHGSKFLNLTYFLRKSIALVRSPIAQSAYNPTKSTTNGTLKIPSTEMTVASTEAIKPVAHHSTT